MTTFFLLVFLLANNGTDIIVYSPGFYTQAEYLKRMSKVIEEKEILLLPDTASSPQIETKDINFLGTPQSPYFVKHYKNYLPVKFKGDTVFIKDTSLVANDYIFQCEFKDSTGRNIALTIARNVEASTGAGSLFGYDFTVSRKRDGMMHKKDLTCFGKLNCTAKGAEISEMEWINKPERKSEVIESSNIKLYYDKNLLKQEESIKFLHLLQIIYDGFTKQYGIFMPETVFVYLYSQDISIKREFSCYSSPFNTIWLKFNNREMFLSPKRGSPIYTIAHEMARISFQPLSNVYPPAMGADDWSHYAPLVGIIPYVDSILGDSAWLNGYDYQSYGIPKFEKIYNGAENTYASLLYEIDKKYGKRVIGDAINDVIKWKYWRHPRMDEFMKVLGGKTQNKDIIKRIKQAYPTPFEHSLLRWKRWKKFGFEPSLQDMFIENRFFVAGIVACSVADSVSFKKNDKIIRIDGFDLKKQKADCYRNLLGKNIEDKVIFSIIRNSKLVQIMVVIR